MIHSFCKKQNRIILTVGPKIHWLPYSVTRLTIECLDCKHVKYFYLLLRKHDSRFGPLSAIGFLFTCKCKYAHISHAISHHKCHSLALKVMCASSRKCNSMCGLYYRIMIGFWSWSLINAVKTECQTFILIHKCLYQFCFQKCKKNSNFCWIKPNRNWQIHFLGTHATHV